MEIQQPWTSKVTNTVQIRSSRCLASFYFQSFYARLSKYTTQAAMCRFSTAIPCNRAGDSCCSNQMYKVHPLKGQQQHGDTYTVRYSSACSTLCLYTLSKLSNNAARSSQPGTVYSRKCHKLSTVDDLNCNSANCQALPARQTKICLPVIMHAP